MLGENQHLTRLVEDLSLLARTDANVVGIDRQLVDLSSLVTETAQEIGFLAEAQDNFVLYMGELNLVFEPRR